MDNKDACRRCINDPTVQADQAGKEAALRLGDPDNKEWCEVCKSLWLYPNDLTVLLTLNDSV